MEFVFVFWLGFAVVTGVAAAGRGRSGFAWFLIAVAVSPLLGGLLLLAMKNLQPERDAAAAAAVAESETRACPMCAERIRAAARVCRFCGHKLDAAEGLQPG